MKKLSLKNLKLEGKDLLQREQLKAVFGGNMSEGCAYGAGNGNGGWTGTDMGMVEASIGAANNGSNYCCASCCTVGWLDSDHKAFLGC